MRLARIMAEKQISIMELAKKAHVHHTQIYGYISGNKKGKTPTLRTMLALATALQCTLEELTGLESLHDAERRIPELTPDAVKFGKFYESLPDGDPLKEYLRKMIEQKTDSSETGKGIEDQPK